MCLAIPGKILEVTSTPESIGLVDVAGVRRRVNLGLIEEEKAVPGDWVLIHVGFALSKISAQAAEEQMRMLRVLGEDAAAMQEVEGYGVTEEGQPPGQRETG